jgi:DNA-directed RNA polymerase specialized sigma24 family protein
MTCEPTALGEDAFDAFYRREYPGAARLAWLLTRTAASEELVQEAFVSVYQRFAELGRPAAYLRTAIVNGSRTWHRNERRRQSRLHLLPSVAVDAGPPVSGDLADVVARLPYRQRVVIVGRYWGGWSEAEIAETLGCRPGTVKALAARALTRLRKEIRP